MASASVVAVYIENGCACMEVVVDEGQRDRNNRVAHTPYTGRISLTEPLGANEKGVYVPWEGLSDAERDANTGSVLFDALTNVQKKAALTKAASVVRGDSRAPSVLPAITGSVVI